MDYFATYIILSINVFIIGLIISILWLFGNILWSYITNDIYIIAAFSAIIVSIGYMAASISTKIEEFILNLQIKINEKDKKIYELEEELRIAYKDKIKLN